MQELQRQHFVDFAGIVPVAFEVAPHHGFEAFPFEVWPGQRPRVEQHFPNVLGEGIPIPDAEMAELVPPEEEAFDVDGREQMIDPGHPLGHPVVVSVFRFERELEKTPGDHPS